MSTVTAALSHPSGEAVTVTVSAAAVSPATASDFAQSGTTLTIAAGATTSAGLVTVTAADNDAVAADRSVRVSGTTAGGRGAADPAAVTLTIENDDRAPVVTLVLTPDKVAEHAAAWSWVTAKLSRPASEAATVTVTSAPVFPAVAADFFQGGSTLTIAAGATTSTGQVVVIPHGNDVDAPDKEVVVSGRVSGGSGAANPRDVTVTIEDDEALPVVTLLLSEPDASSPDAISENGGVSTVTARLSGKSSKAVTVTVSAAAAGGDTVVGDFALSAAKTLTIAAGSTTSAGTVTVTAVNDAGDATAIHEPDRSVRVSGDAAGGNGVADPAGRTLTIADDESAPGVTLAASPSSIAENGGTATVTAALSGRSRAATTITVTGVSGSWTAGSDATIVIAAGATASATDTATVAAVDDDVHQGSAGRPVTVTATVDNAVGAGAVTGAALTLTDDETLPTVTLALSPASISENGGTATVTARLSAKSSAAVTVTVAAAAVPPAVAGDFALSAAKTLTIAAGATASAGVVTVAAVDNAVEAPDKEVTVSGTAAGGHGAANPANATLTIEDDDGLLSAALALSSASISETGGVSTVTATLRRTSTAGATITVSVAPGSPDPAGTGDWTQSGTTLTFAANSTTSAGLVTISAQPDTLDEEALERATVSGALTTDDPAGPGAVSAATLAIADDDDPPVLSISSPSVAEGDGGSATLTFAVTLDAASGRAVTVDYAEGTGTATAGTDYTALAAGTLTIDAGDTGGTIDVTVAGDRLDEADETVVVTLSNPANATLSATAATGTGAITDDDPLPTVSISSPSVAEGDGGSATLSFKVALDAASGREATVDYAEGAGTATAGTDYTALTAGTLTFAAGETGKTLDVTVAGDALAEANETVVVALSGPANAALSTTAATATGTITDDDAPTATLTVMPASISETGGTATVTATLDGRSSAAATITIAVAPKSSTGATEDDYALGAANTLTIAAGTTTSSGVVTIAAVADTTDAPDKRVTVSGTAAGGHGAAVAAAVELEITDDDDPPAVALVLSEPDASKPDAISENGGVSTVTAGLSHPVERGGDGDGLGGGGGVVGGGGG